MTISDAEFSIATEVLLYSFHKYNPGFDGDVLILTDNLPAEHRQRLERFSPVKFEAPDRRLRHAVDELQMREPRLEGIYRRLFSLEIFRLSQYDRVVYLDSDIYCSGDISPLFDSGEAFLACPDGFTYGDRIRQELKPDEALENSERYGKKFGKTFNAGVLSVGSSLLGDETYEALLSLLDYRRWQSHGPSKFTDQMALNLYFDGQFAELEAKFNYMMFLEEYQKSLEPVSLLDARLVHFAGAIKPWNCYDPAQLAARAPQFVKFVDVWHELLDEARSDGSAEAQRERIRQRFEKQAEWIEAYNSESLDPVGRIY